MARQETPQPHGCVLSLLEMSRLQTRRVTVRRETRRKRIQRQSARLETLDRTRVITPSYSGRDSHSSRASQALADSRGRTSRLIHGHSGRVHSDSGLPSIKTTLGAGVSDLELVVSAYSLVYAVFLITGGRLGDILDRKRIFLFGMTVFTVASALAGYAPSAPFLVGARALQGLGSALMYPQVLSIIQVTFKGSERALALGLFAAISGIGAITGNIVGGLLIQLNIAGLAWRPIFLVNVPVGIIGVVAGLLVLHPSR